MTEVLSRQALSRAASVVVVRVGEKALVLGVTEQQVNLIAETELPAEDDAAPRRTQVIDLPDQLAPQPATAPGKSEPDEPAVPRQRPRRAAAAQQPRKDGALAGSAL